MFSPQLGAPEKTRHLGITSLAPWFKITAKLVSPNFSQIQARGPVLGKLGGIWEESVTSIGEGFSGKLPDVWHFCSSHVMTMYVHCGLFLHHGPEIFHSNSFNKASKLAEKAF